MTKFLNNADIKGYIAQTAVTSYLLKADSTGRLVAAIAGTDYQAPTTALLPSGGTAGQILAKIDGTNYNTQWIDNYTPQVKHDVKLGATLSKGTPVYVSNANGTNMIVSAASNASEATSSKTLGLLESGGVLNDTVKVVTEGLLAGLDTSTATAGDPVWLGPSGTLLYGLANKPSAPVHMVFIGIVTRVQSVNGEIFVKVQNGFELDELHNVALSSVADGQGLFYESATNLWKNKTIAAVLGYTPANGANYLPLSGGTLTGALSGTSATFSGDLTSLSATINGTTNAYLNLNAANAGGNEAGVYFKVGGVAKWEQYTAANDGNLSFWSNGNGIRFYITPTGGGVFTGNISASNFRVYNGSTTGGYLIPKAGWVGSGTDYSPSIAAETTYGINFFTNGSASVKMYLATTGQLQLNTYTSSTSYSGTAAGYLAFDSSGNVITVAGVAATDNTKLPLAGGTMTGALVAAAGDRGFEVNASGGISLYSNEINAGALGGTGTIYLGWRRTTQVNVGVPMALSSSISATSGSFSGALTISKDIGTNDYPNTGQHNMQLRIRKASTDGGCAPRTLELGVLDNGTGIIQSQHCGVGYNTLALNPVSGTVTINGSTAWHAGNLTNLNQLTNGPGYITSSGNISGYAMSLNGYANQTEYTILTGPANGPVIKVRYDSATANRYIDFGSKDGNGVYYEGLKIYNGNTPTWGGNTILHAGNIGSYTSGNSNQLQGSSAPYLFNNMNNAHGTYTDFNSPGDFGVRYMQGSTNGPGTGASQYYGFTLGLGSQYAFGTYGSQLYWNRVATGGNPYISVRFQEGGSWSSWSKIYAGYADSAGQVTINYNNDSNSTYQLLWGSGNSVYGTSGVYVNPYTDYVHATSYKASDWFRSSGTTGWYNETYSGGMYMIDTTWVRSYNNTGIYSNNEVRGNKLRSETNIYTDGNYGYGLVGTYTSTRYQGVFAMGDSYKLPADGSTTGSLYGLAWSHPNAGGVAGNLNTHGLLVMENGTFLAAISGSIRARDDVRAPALYDSGSRVAISRGEGRNYVDYSRYVYNNGAYSGSGWIEPSDLGVRYASSAGSASYSNYVELSGNIYFNGSGYHNVRMYESYGIVMNCVSHPWHVQVLNGSLLVGISASGANYGTGHLYTNGFIRPSGDYGLYSQDYGGYFRRNTYSYGTWESTGYAKNGWGGYVNNNNYIVSWMLNTSGDFGFLTENGNWWNLFYNNGNNCWGIGTDNTYSGDGFRCIKYGSAQYGWTTWSDRRAKENISTITGALDKVLNMRGVYFNYIIDEAKNKRVGFIAQELQEALPEAVRYAEEIDEYNVEYGQIVSVLAEAVKEHYAKTVAQQIEIDALKTQLQTLLN